MLNLTKVFNTIGFPQYTPSSYLLEMKQTTEEKLAATREMYPPKIVQLLDIGTSSYQKVLVLSYRGKLLFVHAYHMV